MYKNETYLAIIPARGGSKGLPGKNKKMMHGKPLIAWSIEVALKSEYLDEVVVSTDSHEIAEIAKKYGAHVPFIRPEALSSDHASSIDVIIHCIEFLKASCGKTYDYVVLLEPTSPLRTVEDIDRAIEKLSLVGAQSVVGVCRAEAQNPAFLMTVGESGRIKGYAGNEIKSVRRQDVEDVYYLEGTIYISKTETLMSKRTFYHNDTVAYEVPKWKSLEVDDMDDWIMIEALIEQKGYLQ